MRLLFGCFHGSLRYRLAGRRRRIRTGDLEHGVFREGQRWVEHAHVNQVIQLQDVVVLGHLTVEQVGARHLVDEEDVSVTVGGHRLHRRGEDGSPDFRLPQLEFQAQEQVLQLVAALDVQGDLLDAGGDALGVLLH